jgi:hypothetical protein
LRITKFPDHDANPREKTVARFAHSFTYDCGTAGDELAEIE